MKATKCLVSLALALAGVSSGFSAAVDISGKDPSEWPTSGDIAITSGTITVTDDEVDIAAGWENVTISSSATLKINNTSKPLVFKAKINGNCWFRADDSCGLTLAGDNSGHWGNQNFKFVDSNVIVAHEYGLGKNDKNLRCEFTYTVGKTTGNLTFHNPAWDDPDFTGKKAFTNHCHILFRLSGTEAYPDDGKFLAIGSSAADEYFVQDGNFLFDYTAKQTSFRYNYEQISGQFGPSFQTTGYTFTRQSKDCAGELRFSGTTKINGAFVENTTQFGSWLNYHRNTHFGHSGGTHIIYARDQGNDFLESDNVFDDFVAGCDPIAYQPIAMDQSVYKNSMDLQGHSVRFKEFQNYYSAVPTATSSSHYYLTSSVPATVTLYRETKTGADTANPTPTELRGAVSLVIDNGVTNRLSTRLSKTTGTLTVKSGSALVYQWKGGWAGSAVTVEAGACLDALSERALSAGTAVLTVEAGGKLRLHAGSDAVFTAATVGGQRIYADDYTVASLKEAYPAAVDCVEGDDTAVVKVTGLPWTGWPDVEGGFAEVPKNASVAITDDDVEKVAKLSEIWLCAGSTVTCSSTAALAIRAKIAGSGTFRIVNAENVVILGDNSNLVAPGCFYIENSAVAVSNRFGLGSAQTGAATVNFGSISRKLVFGLENCRAFTNDVALVLGQVGSGAVGWIGSSATDEYLVQNADVTLTAFRDYVTRLTYGGNVEFAAGTVSVSGALYLYGDMFAHLTFGAGASFVNTTSTPKTIAFYGAGYNVGMDAIPVVDFGPQSATGVGGVVREICVLRFPKANVFADGSVASLLYTTATLAQAAHGVVDFCGCDQTLGGMSVHYSSAKVTEGNKQIAPLVSEAPATVTIQTDAEDLVREQVNFEGALGYRYNGAGTNLLCNLKSTSTGGFRVSSGVAGFDWGATWGGTNIVVDGTGTLYVGAGSAAAGVFGSASGVTKSQALLTVSDAGRLYLESGETVVFNAIGSTGPLNRGIYCSAENAEAKASGALGVDWIAGAGTLRVLKGPVSGMVLLLR